MFYVCYSNNVQIPDPSLLLDLKLFTYSLRYFGCYWICFLSKHNTVWISQTLQPCHLRGRCQCALNLWTYKIVLLILCFDWRGTTNIWKNRSQCFGWHEFKPRKKCFFFVLLLNNSHTSFCLYFARTNIQLLSPFLNNGLLSVIKSHPILYYCCGVCIVLQEVLVYWQPQTATVCIYNGAKNNFATKFINFTVSLSLSLSVSSVQHYSQSVCLSCS